MEELSMMEDKGTTKSLPLFVQLSTIHQNTFFLKPCLNLSKKSFSSEWKHSNTSWKPHIKEQVIEENNII